MNKVIRNIILSISLIFSMSVNVNALTLGEVNATLNDAFNSNLDTKDNTIATVNNTLIQYAQANKNRFISYDNELSYNLGDTELLSNNTWEFIESNLNLPVNKLMLEIGISKVKDTENYLKNLNIQNYEDYSSLIHSYYSEYASLVDNNPEAIKYWLLHGGNSDISIILHEVLHEQSARLSGRFMKRTLIDDVWAVHWKVDSDVNYVYNFQTKNWDYIESIKLPKTQDVLTNTPDDIARLSSYKTYALSEHNFSNVYGVYGMLNELMSFVGELRINVISESIQYKATEIDSNNIDNYYLLRGLILNYLGNLESQNINLYNQVISDKVLVKHIIDNLDYGDEQFGLALNLDNSSNTKYLRDWAYNKTAINQYYKLYYLANDGNMPIDELDKKVDFLRVLKIIDSADIEKLNEFISSRDMVKWASRMYSDINESKYNDTVITEGWTDFGVLFTSEYIQSVDLVKTMLKASGFQKFSEKSYREKYSDLDNIVKDLNLNPNMNITYGEAFNVLYYMLNNLGTQTKPKILEEYNIEYIERDLDNPDLFIRLLYDIPDYVFKYIISNNWSIKIGEFTGENIKSINSGYLDKDNRIIYVTNYSKLSDMIGKYIWDNLDSHNLEQSLFKKDCVNAIEHGVAMTFNSSEYIASYIGVVLENYNNTKLLDRLANSTPDTYEYVINILKYLESRY